MPKTQKDLNTEHPSTHPYKPKTLNAKRLTLNAKSNLSPELLFLIACCKTERSEDDINFIEDFIQHCPVRKCPWGATFNIQHLTTLASRHGILPLVYQTLKSLHATRYTLHAEILAAFKQQYLTIAQRNMLMSAELLRIINLLRENNIEALAFKGPALSQMAYGDITLRQYSDLDILVDGKDAYEAGRLMSGNGHTPILPLSILSNKTCLHTAKDFSLMSKGGVHTELHWRLFEKKYNISLLSCAAEQKCQSVTINGKAVKTLQNELLLVYLCLHGAKHAFERIEWICDIDRLIRSGEVDWVHVISLAEQSHSKRSFYLGLSLAHTLLRTPVPENLMPAVQDETIQTLQSLVLSQMMQEKEGRSDFEKNRETFAFQSRLFDTRYDMLRFKLSTFFKISTTDCQTFVLPEQLKFLYIILRPLRLSGSYIGCLFKSK